MLFAIKINIADHYKLLVNFYVSFHGFCINLRNHFNHNNQCIQWSQFAGSL